MSPEPSSKNTKTCPTCGTRLNENATRCLVCGRNFTSLDHGSSKPVQGARMPEITLSLPIALGLMVIVLAIGAGVVFSVLRSTGRVVEPTATITPSLTATITLTEMPTLTPTPLPTFTPLPPLEYTIQEGDLCSSIAAYFNISVNSIVLLNNLPTDCGMLFIGQKLLIPQPTPTASPLPTNTLGPAEATEAACEKLNYEVKENDTLSIIAANYNISIEALKSYNGLTSDIVYQGQTIIIPLCARKPTAGPTPTPTLPPPYPPPNLLLPIDGAAFMAMNDIITLQWAAVGTLQQNEAYAVTVEDVTSGEGPKLVEYVTDTKYIIPSNLRPRENVPHVFRWSVLPVRQISTTKEGKPIWDSAGASSIQRVFTWWGVGEAENTPTP